MSRWDEATCRRADLHEAVAHGQAWAEAVAGVTMRRIAEAPEHEDAERWLAALHVVVEETASDLARAQGPSFAEAWRFTVEDEIGTRLAEFDRRATLGAPAG